MRKWNKWVILACSWLLDQYQESTMFTLILSTMFVSQEKKKRCLNIKPSQLHVNTSGTYISLSSSDGAFSRLLLPHLCANCSGVSYIDCLCCICLTWLVSCSTLKLFSSVHCLCLLYPVIAVNGVLLCFIAFRG